MSRRLGEIEARVHNSRSDAAVQIFKNSKCWSNCIGSQRVLTLLVNLWLTTFRQSNDHSKVEHKSAIIFSIAKQGKSELTKETLTIFASSHRPIDLFVENKQSRSAWPAVANFAESFFLFHQRRNVKMAVDLLLKRLAVSSTQTAGRGHSPR